jgi:1-acyl-sn-glycerol-3-phosphate acyltransferase
VERVRALLEAREPEPTKGSLLASFLSRVKVDEKVVEETNARLGDLDEELGEFGYDAFGFSPDQAKKMLYFSTWLYRKYFRVQTSGIDNIPEGPVLLIANHSGQIPIDGMMIVTACLLDKAKPRMVRSMVERWVPTIPFVSWIMARAGQIVGTRDNFRRVVEQGSAILVFPEGVVGINKTWDRAYQLQRFGFGFMRLALENALPVVPVAVVGAEEQAPSFYNLKSVARVLGAPAFPITPTFPLLGPLGLLPLPSRYHIYFGEPMSFEGEPDDEDKVIAARVDKVKEAIDAMLKQGLAERQSVYF